MVFDTYQRMRAKGTSWAGTSHLKGFMDDINTQLGTPLEVLVLEVIKEMSMTMNKEVTLF